MLKLTLKNEKINQFDGIINQLSITNNIDLTEFFKRSSPNWTLKKGQAHLLWQKRGNFIVLILKHSIVSIYNLEKVSKHI